MKEMETLTDEQVDREVEESRRIARKNIDCFKLSNDSESIEDIISGIERGLKDGSIVDNYHETIEWRIGDLLDEN